MNIDKVRGPGHSSDDKRTTHANRESFQDKMRVERVGETDPDQRKKRREREEEEPISQNKKNVPRPRREPTNKKSILESSFQRKDIYGRAQYSSSQKGYGSPEPSHVPSSPPSYSPSNPLPSSRSFWEENDPYNRQQENRTPDGQRPVNSNNLRRKEPEESSQGTTHKTASHKKKEKEESPNGIFLGDGEDGMGKMGKKPDGKKSGPKGFVPSTDADPKPAGAKKKSHGPIVKIKDEPEEPGHLSTKEKEKEAAPKAPSLADSSTPSKGSHKKEEKLEAKKEKSEGAPKNLEGFAEIVILDSSKEHKSKDKHDNAQISTEKPMQIPPQAMAQAVSATTQVSSYITPEAKALFTQMVGTIIIMSSKGVDRTEVILNSSAFQNSPFFGAKVVFEKYATAPDAFNIRFTGTTKQISSFNANLEGLNNAFQQGKFNFRIGRLEASYQPLFHRKKKAGDKGSDMGGMGKGS